jgi:hypothetical protein
MLSSLRSVRAFLARTGIALGAICALLITGATPASAVGGGFAINTVGPNLVPDNADRVLDVAGYSTADRGRVHMWDYRVTGNVQNQRWNIVAVGGGNVQIVNRNSGKCLDKSMDQGNIDGALVYQYTCAGSEPSNQLWWFDNNGAGGRQRIHSVADGRCLDIRNKVDADDATVQVWGCNAIGWNQSWYVTSE